MEVLEMIEQKNDSMAVMWSIFSFIFLVFVSLVFMLMYLNVIVKILIYNQRHLNICLYIS